MHGCTKKELFQQAFSFKTATIGIGILDILPP